MPILSLLVLEGVPAGLAGLCFNYVELGHVVDVCEGRRRLNCKSEHHITRQCPTVGPQVDAVVVFCAPPPPPLTVLAPSAPWAGPFTPTLHRVLHGNGWVQRRWMRQWPLLHDVSKVFIEMSYQHGLRRVRNLHAALPLQHEQVTRGYPLYEHGLRCDKELRWR
jgi:hypothetical protein